MIFFPLARIEEYARQGIARYDSFYCSFLRRNRRKEKYSSGFFCLDLYFIYHLRLFSPSTLLLSSSRLSHSVAINAEKKTPFGLILKTRTDCFLRQLRREKDCFTVVYIAIDNALTFCRLLFSQRILVTQNNTMNSSFNTMVGLFFIYAAVVTTGK